MRKVALFLLISSHTFAVTCPSGYSYYSTITIDHTKVATAGNYNNPLGKGDRTATITVTTNLSVGGSGTVESLVNGTESSDNVFYFNAQSVTSSLYIKFNLGAQYLITEALHFQSTTDTHGVWQWQGSNDDSSYTNIGGTFTMGGAISQAQTSLNGNTTQYQYYRLQGVSGTTSSSPWIYEYEFKINANQTNFPVLISTTVANLATTGNGGHVQNANGYDIILSSTSDGNYDIKFETETYNASTGQIIYWAKLGNLSHTADTVLYLFYGNSGVSTFQGGAWGAVWDSNYKAVWHLADNAANTIVAQATSNSFTGTNAANTNTKTATGKIGNGLTYASASSDGTTMPNINANFVPTAFTLSGWIKTTNSTTHNQRIVTFADSIPGTDVFISVDHTGLDAGGAHKAFVAAHAGGWSNQYKYGTITVDDMNWHYIVGTFDGTNFNLYVDGNNDGTKVAGAAPYGGTNSPFTIGKYPLSAADFANGIIDEPRVSTSARSADWVATEYNNQGSPNTFFSYGTEQTCGGGGGGTTYVPLNRGMSIQGGKSVIRGGKVQVM
jgi:hypothetical protein